MTRTALRVALNN